ncbi:MAG: winged helix-turn-helix domain-containing protein [Pyrinomonadaceae bacterium]
METAEDKGFVYEFGKFVLDPKEKTLFSDGVPIHLPAKEFETLLLLVEHNGKALSKDEMMSAIWQDAFVEESNLAKQISRLRKILNSNGEEYIETLPKHGYRFSTELSRSITENTAPIILEKRTVKRLTLAVENGIEETPPLLPGGKGKRRTPFYLAAIAAAIIAVIGIVFVWKYQTAPANKISSIAVLPLRSLTPGSDNDAVRLGLTDSLITKLGALKQVVVRPIGSVTRFSESDEDALEIGRKLRVDAVFDGTIQESNGHLRINARLISTSTGEQIWAEKFDDNFTNIFEVQDRLSELTARALTATLTGEPAGRLTKRYTENPAAFDAYLKGRYHWNKRNEQDFRRAVTFFNQAVALDPNYALAYAGLADCYILLAVWGTEPPGISLPKAKDAALKALAADGELAEAHTSLAFIKWVYDWDFDGANNEFDAALRLNPNYATAHHWRSYYLVSTGRNEEAIEAIKRAQELEGPLSLGIMTDIGEVYCWARQYENSIEHLGEVVKIEPNYAIAHYAL